MQPLILNLTKNYKEGNKVYILEEDNKNSKVPGFSSYYYGTDFLVFLQQWDLDKNRFSTILVTD